MDEVAGTTLHAITVVSLDISENIALTQLVANTKREIPQTRKHFRAYTTKFYADLHKAFIRGKEPSQMEQLYTGT